MRTKKVDVKNAEEIVQKFDNLISAIQEKISDLHDEWEIAKATLKMALAARKFINSEIEREESKRPVARPRRGSKSA